MMKQYNPEHNEYTHYIPLEDLPQIQQRLEELRERIKNAPVYKPYHQGMANETVQLDINDVESVKQFLEHEENFRMDDSINNRHASFFLIACYFCNNNAVIRYLVEAGSSVNRVDVFGYNGVMSVILNECMELEAKLETIAYLIDNGCDVNWLNSRSESALTIALNRMDIEIAHLLLDKGAVIYSGENGVINTTD